ncbi:hypothetical protein GCM10027403_10370 [Arthrobacter tecti]
MTSRRFFLYTSTEDLASSRRFYTDLVGLVQIWDEPDGVAYGIDDAVQFSIDFNPDAKRVTGWSFQPGWVYGLGIESRPTSAHSSWSIPLAPRQFKEAVARLQAAGSEALRPEPFWVGYWSYVVKDPMGRTVELSDPVSKAPADWRL